MNMERERKMSGSRRRGRVGEEEPCYVISVVADLVGIHAQTLRYYERMGLIEPSRRQNQNPEKPGIRLYSQRDVEKLQQIQRLVRDLGVNLAGVEVILNMNEKLERLETELSTAREELEHLRMQINR